MKIYILTPAIHLPQKLLPRTYPRINNKSIISVFFSLFVLTKKLNVLAQCSIIALGFMLHSYSFGATVFINEFHYDNIGADENEFIEIFATANTNLNNWKILFYNGNNGNIYKNIRLTGLISDMDNGFGVLAFSTNGIQNGPADAIALINNVGTVIEFISYEGAITATEGAAKGMKSTDVLYFEDTDTEHSFSIQRIGSGAFSENFSWQANTASFGEINLLQLPTITTVPLPMSITLYFSALLCLRVLRRL